MPTNPPVYQAPHHIRLILRQVPGAAWATDRELRITYAHGGASVLDGVEAQTLVGSTVYEFVESDEATEPLIAHHLAALTGERQSFRYVRRGRSLEVLIEPLRDEEGAIVGCVGAAIDVTDLRDVQDRLARTEARLAEAQRVAHVGSFEWDASKDRVRWSDELHRIYGVAPEAEGTLDAFLARVHDDDEARVRALIFDAFRRSGPFSYDHRIVRPDGKVRVLHTSGDVVTDATGAVRVVGSCWDVTTQHETTQKLLQSVSLLHATLDATADGILVVDRRGRVTAHNRKFLTMWRVPQSLAARGDDMALLTYVSDQLEDPKAFMDGVQGLYSSPDQDAFDVIRFRDGRVFERYSMPQLVAGAVAGRVWSFRDVTERERLLVRATFLADATRLLASLDIKKALRSVANLAVPYLGERCAVDLLNAGNPERLLAAGGVDDATGHSPELHPGVLAGHSMLYGASSRSHMATPLVSRNTVMGALTFMAPLGRHYTNDDLELLCEIGRRVALSIDNARLYEGAREALSGRDEFLSIAAHEIRGPLTAMHLAVQSLLRGTLSSAGAHMALDTIQREDRRLARFVDELLDLGHIRAGQMHFDLKPVDLGTLVRDVVSRMSDELARAGSGVTVRTDGDLVGQWDRFRIEQVVTNLLSNAIKYGNGKPIEVSAVGANARVSLRVVDHGIGIEPAALGKIFDPYERAVGSRHYGGLGLGLHISKTVVEGLGGTIAVESRLGEGATFTVDLPLSRSA